MGDRSLTVDVVEAAFRVAAARACGSGCGFSSGSGEGTEGPFDCSTAFASPCCSFPILSMSLVTICQSVSIKQDAGSAYRLPSGLRSSRIHSLSSGILSNGCGVPHIDSPAAPASVAFSIAIPNSFRGAEVGASTRMNSGVK